MSLASWTIIYLSIGAPFAARRFFSDGEQAFVRLLFPAVARFLVWPLFLVLDLATWAANQQLDEHQAEVGNDRVRFSNPSELCQNILPRLPIIHREDFSFAVETYVAMTKAIGDSEFGEKTNSEDCFEPIFDLAGHPSPKVGAKCLARKTLARIRKKRSDSLAIAVSLFESGLSARDSLEVFEFLHFLVSNSRDNVGLAMLSQLENSVAHNDQEFGGPSSLRLEVAQESGN